MALQSAKSSETRNISVDDTDSSSSSSSSTPADSSYEASIERRVRPYVDTVQATGQLLSASMALPAEDSKSAMNTANSQSNSASTNTAQHVLEERLRCVAPDVLRRMYLDEHAEYLTVLDEILLLQSELDDCEDRLGAALDKQEATQKEVEQLQMQLALAEEQVGALLHEKAETLASLADAKSELAELSARRLAVQSQQVQQAQATPPAASHASPTANVIQAAQSARSQRWAMERLQASQDELKARVAQLESALVVQRTRNAQLASSESSLLAEVSRLAQQLREAEARQRAARSTPRASLARLTNTPSPRAPTADMQKTKAAEGEEAEEDDEGERVVGERLHDAVASPLELHHNHRSHNSANTTHLTTGVNVFTVTPPSASRTLVKVVCTTSTNTIANSKEGLSEEVHEVVTEEPTTTTMASSTQIDGESGWSSSSPTTRSLEQRGMERVLRIASSVRRRQAALHELCGEERAALRSQS